VAGLSSESKSQIKHERAINAKLRRALEDARMVIQQLKDVASKPMPTVDLSRVRAKLDGIVTEIEKAWTSAGQQRERELAAVKSKADRIVADIEKMLATVGTIGVSEVESPRVPSGARSPAPPRERPSSGKSIELADGGSLPSGEQKILMACAQYDEGCTREQLTVLTALKRSTRDTYIQRLRERGFVDSAGEMIIATTEGIAALGDSYEPLPTGDALREYWLGRLPEGERRILELLAEKFPEAVSRDEISEVTGFSRSTRDTYLQRMGSKRVVNAVGRGEVKASEQLFDLAMA
jgi:hypothetical protein